MPIFLQQGSAAQLISGQMICFLAVLCYSKWQPYYSSLDLKLELAAQTTLFFELSASIFFHLQPESDPDEIADLLCIALLFPVVLASCYSVGFEIDM